MGLASTVLIAVAACVLAGCHAGSPHGPQPLAVNREQARSTLAQHCGTCHASSLPSALPGALAVFDLDQPDRSARMSDAQLRNASWRLGETLHQMMPGHARPDAGGISPLEWPNDIFDGDRKQFQRFIELEIKHRSSAS
jgi:hypothetical protein